MGVSVGVSVGVHGDGAVRAARVAVAIMAKESTPGRVKTRLVPPLTHAESAALNTCFLRDISANIAEAARSVAIEGFAAYHPEGAEDFFRGVLAPGFGLLPPREAGIGRSLPHAARDLLGAGFGGCCLVNADSPNLPTEVLVEAVRRLMAPGDRVVLGPSEDGGYYLIGLKRFHPRLFEEIAWSTERVHGQTVARAWEIGLPVATLPVWYDVDDAAMLVRLRDDLHGAERRGSAAPQSARFLTELAASGRLSGVAAS